MNPQELVAGICQTLIENTKVLDHLDSVCGDGETGSNLARGASAVSEAASDPLELKSLGLALNSAGCGTLGTILSFLLMRTDKANTLAEAMDIMESTFRKHSDAQIGDKTMADVLLTWIDCIRERQEWENIRREIKRSLDATKDMPGKKGRGEYIQNRSIGTIDPGAMATYIILLKVSDYLEEKGIYFEESNE